MTKPWFEYMLEDFLTYEEGPGECPTADQLVRYAQARIRDEDLDAELQGVAQHIERCPACKHESEALIRTLGAEELAPLPRPISPLAKDFLARLQGLGKGAPEQHQPWLAEVNSRLDAVIDALRAGVQLARISLREVAGKLYVDTSPLLLSPGTATRSVRGDERLYRYEIPKLAVTVTLIPKQTARGWIITGELEPDSADREGLSGVELKISAEDAPGERAYEVVRTDEMGCFIFEGLEPGRYLVEIPVTNTESIVLRDIVVG